MGCSLVSWSSVVDPVLGAFGGELVISYKIDSSLSLALVLSLFPEKPVFGDHVRSSHTHVFAIAFRLFLVVIRFSCQTV